MSTFITPDTGTAELTAVNGLLIVSSGEWRRNPNGSGDGTSFGLSLSGPDVGGNFYGGTGPIPGPPQSGGELHLSAQGWSIPGGNALTSYTYDGTTYGPERCRITITGRWWVPRQPNTDSFNSVGIFYSATTTTDLGSRSMNPWLLNFESDPATYIIQGADVQGGAQDTFTDHVFYCRLTESVTSDNSNRSYQSNSITRPVWIYQYQRAWQID